MITLNRRRVMGRKGDIESPNVVALFDVTSTTEATKLNNGISNFSEIIIDGVPLPSPRSSYTFDTIGEHIVEYVLIDTTFVTQLRDCVAMKEVIIPEGVQTLGNYVFYADSGLEKVTLPRTIQTLSGSCFDRCSRVATFIIKSPIPPTVGGNAFRYNTNGIFYVPDDSVDAYKTATSWYSFRNRIKPMSELPQ